MSASLSGKAALVTGGSRGIGAAIARQLAKDGAAVAVTYVSTPEKAEALVKEIQAAGGKAVAIKADAVDAAAVRHAVAETVRLLGRLDILVNNAGVGLMGSLEEFSLEDFDRQMAVNVRSMWVATQEAAKHLPSGGRVVNIGSCVSDRIPFPGLAAYSMTKAAVAGLTQGLARELGAKGITINNVQPGPIDTDMNPANGPNAEMMTSLLALPRFGRVDEVAALVSHLVGPSGGFITGGNFLIDGGFAA